MSAMITGIPFGRDEAVKCQDCQHYIATNDYCRVIKKGVNPYAVTHCRYYKKRKKLVKKAI